MRSQQTADYPTVSCLQFSCCDIDFQMPFLAVWERRVRRIARALCVTVRDCLPANPDQLLVDPTR